MKKAKAKASMAAKAKMVMAKVKAGAADIKDGKAVTKEKDLTGSKAGTTAKAKESLAAKAKIKEKESLAEKERDGRAAAKEKVTTGMIALLLDTVEIAGSGGTRRQTAIAGDQIAMRWMWVSCNSSSQRQQRQLHHQAQCPPPHRMLHGPLWDLQHLTELE